MRMGRIKEQGAGYYHIVSRVVDRRMVLDANEKERFRKLMRSTEAFSGCDVLTWTALDNHFHVMLYVPAPHNVADDELVRRLGFLYDQSVVDTIVGELGKLRADGQDFAADALKERYTYRMYDLSEFVKTLKQRFTQSYNRRHGRKGTLWEERFKSLLVGGSEAALSAVAAYIDLNAVRAGIVSDPKHYRYCGYAEAVGGSKSARRGMTRVMVSLGQKPEWRDVACKYRKLIYIRGQVRRGDNGALPKLGFSAQKVKAVIEAGGELPLNELLRCRVRYFTDGAVFGAREFAQEAFERHRHHFGERRQTGGRRMQGADWGDLCILRRLRVDVISPPVNA
jgi:putative transposase